MPQTSSCRNPTVSPGVTPTLPWPQNSGRTSSALEGCPTTPLVSFQEFLGYVAVVFSLNPRFISGHSFRLHLFEMCSVYFAGYSLCNCTSCTHTHTHIAAGGTNDDLVDFVSFKRPCSLPRVLNHPIGALSSSGWQPPCYWLDQASHALLPYFSRHRLHSHVNQLPVKAFTCKPPVSRCW